MSSQAAPIDQQIPQALADKPASLEQCHAVIDALTLQIEQLREQMAAMQEQLKLNSRNSSKPPSSDGPARPNRAQRRASERKRGAQKGHSGSDRALLDEQELNGVHDCLPEPQCECADQVHVRGKPVPHQVFDIPAVKADVQEYRLYSGVCAGCGKAHRAVLPAGVPSGQIGPHLGAGPAGAHGRDALSPRGSGCQLGVGCRAAGTGRLQRAAFARPVCDP